MAAVTSGQPCTTTRTPGSAKKYTGRSATSGWSEVSLTETLRGVGTPREATQSLTRSEERRVGDDGTTSSGTATAPPLALEAWKGRVAVAETAPGSWLGRYATKPGRTVPSANRN